MNARTIPGPLTSRSATVEDKPFLYLLRRQTMEPLLAAAGVLLSAEEHRLRVLYHFDRAEILLLNGEPSGLLKVVRAPGVWEILQIQIVPALQGLGLGRGVIEGVVAQARRDCAVLTLRVLKVNPATRLYARLGFRITAEEQYEYEMTLDPD